MGKKITNTSLFSLCFTIILSSILSCKKAAEPQVLNELSTSGLKSTDNFAAMKSSPTPPLDWENISFMPTPPNSPSIPVPWQGGLGGAKIDDEIIFDYHAADGWELVYNTFTPSTTYNLSYFMLYNKYRGVLRLYTYIAPGGNYPSSNLTHFLNLRGTNISTSPILNFAGQEVVNTAVFSSSVAQLQPFKVSTTGSWYAAEFEVAYDQSTSVKPYEQFRLEWQIHPNSITTITLNGTQTGQMNGTLQTNAGGPNFFSQLTNGIIDGALKIGSDTIKSKSISFLPTLVKSSLVTATSSALGGIVKGFLSGILGGTSSTSSKNISLKINTNISVSGTATVESQLFDNIFSIPGTQNVINTEPFYPHYDHPLGVFYVSQQPKINKQITSVLVNNEFGNTYTVAQEYTLDENSFSLIFNDYVTSVANITNIQKEVIFLTVSSRGDEVYINGKMENVAGKPIYSGYNGGLLRFERSLQPRPRESSISTAVRISFDVVPKDGSPSCKIIKTFLASQVAV